MHHLTGNESLGIIAMDGCRPMGEKVSSRSVGERGTGERIALSSTYPISATASC